MIEKVKKTIEKYRMLERGDRVLVCVSGGMDSVCLLHLLMELREGFGIDLMVCHLNHCLRGDESLRDERFVVALARQYDLPYEVKREKIESIKKKVMKGSLQEVARFVRYGFFERAAKRHGVTKIALGHNSDDNAETIIMRIIKGSGVGGLKGIPPVRGRYIRPLINTSRREIERYVEELKISYVDDSSNQKKNYLRNRIRSELIPLIEKGYNPNIKDTLSRTASIISMDNEYMDNETDRLLENVVLDRGDDCVSLSVKELLAIPGAIMMRIFIRELSYLYDIPVNISSTHLENMSGLVRGNAPNVRIDLPHGVRLVREYGRIILTRGVFERPLQFEGELKIPGVTYLEEISTRFETKISKKIPADVAVSGKEKAYFDYDSLSMPIKARGFRHGDRLRPMGMGGRKKIKKIFIDCKIPRPLRQKIPILIAGEDIIWVAGVRQSEIGKVNEMTKTVLKVTIHKQGPH
ncbi:MAG: tRNA lysidine(34) synthetase TilS [Thermodesulfobacteriota bacterium]